MIDDKPSAAAMRATGGRLRRLHLLGLASIVSLLLSLAAAEAQDNPDASRIGDWTNACEPAAANGKRKCTMSQTLVDQHGRKIVAFQVAVRENVLYLEVNAPLGISIGYGVVLIVDNQTKYPMRLIECEPAGCRAILGFDQGIVAKFKAAKQLSVMFQDSKSAKVLTVPCSTKGLTNGLTIVQAGA